MLNLDENEVAKLDSIARSWWDPNGDFRPLHDINPARLRWIAKRTVLAGTKILDVGCGGGLLTEAMAHEGALLTGIDVGDNALEVARLHCLESGLNIDYRNTTVEQLAAKEDGYGVITCLELLEHVPNPALVVAAAKKLVIPGGDVFFSTINRNVLAWLTAIIGAEYVFNLLPRGTHNYPKLIRPAELAGYARSAGLVVREISGMVYNPFNRSCRISGSPDVQYIMHCIRPEE